MHNANYHRMWYENSMRNARHSIIKARYKYTVEIWYRPDKLYTLDLGFSKHHSWADTVWLLAGMLADNPLHIARMLASSA